MPKHRPNKNTANCYENEAEWMICLLAKELSPTFPIAIHFDLSPFPINAPHACLFAEEHGIELGNIVRNTLTILAAKIEATCPTAIFALQIQFFLNLLQCLVSVDKLLCHLGRNRGDANLSARNLIHLDRDKDLRISACSLSFLEPNLVLDIHCKFLLF
jgi:hypothetical protein